MRCGHVIHKECFRKHTENGYTCPLCQKSLTDMSEYFQQLDERLARETLPPEVANRRTRVSCRDCDERSVVQFHFKYHKCAICGSYNTQVLAYEDVQGRWMADMSSRAGSFATPAAAATTTTTTTSSESAPRLEDTR